MSNSLKQAQLLEAAYDYAESQDTGHETDRWTERYWGFIKGAEFTANEPTNNSSLNELRDRLAKEFDEDDNELDRRVWEYPTPYESFQAGFDAGVKAAAEPIPVIPDITLKPCDYVVDQYECPKCGTMWAVSDPKLPCPTCEPTTNIKKSEVIHHMDINIWKNTENSNESSPIPPSEQDFIDKYTLRPSETEMRLKRELAEAREEIKQLKSTSSSTPPSDVTQIHTCHERCNRTACILQRELVQAQKLSISYLDQAQELGRQLAQTHDEFTRLKHDYDGDYNTLSEQILEVTQQLLDEKQAHEATKLDLKEVCKGYWMDRDLLIDAEEREAKLDRLLVDLINDVELYGDGENVLLAGDKAREALEQNRKARGDE